MAQGMLLVVLVTKSISLIRSYKRQHVPKIQRLKYVPVCVCQLLHQLVQTSSYNFRNIKYNCSIKFFKESVISEFNVIFDGSRRWKAINRFQSHKHVILENCGQQRQRNPEKLSIHAHWVTEIVKLCFKASLVICNCNTHVFFGGCTLLFNTKHTLFSLRGQARYMFAITTSFHSSTRTTTALLSPFLILKNGTVFWGIGRRSHGTWPQLPLSGPCSPCRRSVGLSTSSLQVFYLSPFSLFYFLKNVAACLNSLKT